MVQPPRAGMGDRPPALWRLLLFLGAVIISIVWLQHYAAVHGAK